MLVIALIGGGLEIKELKIPKVDNTARLLSGIAGFLLLAVAIVNPQFLKNKPEKSGTDTAEKKETAKTSSNTAAKSSSTTKPEEKPAQTPPPVQNAAPSGAAVASPIVDKSARGFADQIWQLFDAENYAAIFQRSTLESAGFTLSSWQAQVTKVTQDFGKIGGRVLCSQTMLRTGKQRMLYTARSDVGDVVLELDVIPDPNDLKKYLVSGLHIRPPGSEALQCNAQ